MSHTVEVKTKFKQEQVHALKKALEHLNWQWEENTTMKEYSGQGTKKFRYVGKNPNRQSYDVGFEVDKDGNLTPYTDLWGGSVEATLGKDFSKLKQEYGFRVIEDHYEALGAMVSREWTGQTMQVTVDMF